MSDKEEERFRSRYGSRRTAYGSDGGVYAAGAPDGDGGSDETFVYPFKIDYTAKESEGERRTDMQAAGEDFSPFASYGGVQSTEQLSQEQEGEQINESEFEYELFANEVHSHEFEGFLSELAAEAETKFLNHVVETHSVSGELEQVLRHPSFESMFNSFYETNYGEGVRRAEAELESFSNYLQTNLQPEMEYEAAKRVIDSYQPSAESEYAVQPEQFGFFKRIFDKVKGIAKGVIKTGLNIVKSGVKFVGSKILGPILNVLKKVWAWLKPRIKTVLKGVLRLGLRLIPADLRPWAQKAISLIREQETFTGEGEEESEATAELEFEEEDEDYVNEDLSSESEEELFHSDEFQIAEFERAFDRRVFSYAESELRQALQTGQSVATATYTPEAEGEGFSQEDMASFNEALIYDSARTKFVNGLTTDPNPNVRELTEEFLPAILMGLRLVMKIPPVRKKVIDLIAGLIEKLLGKAIPIPENLRTPLFRAIASAGLRLLTLEAPNEVPANQNKVVAETIANIMTEAVERVATLPESILEAEDQVLESHVQEAVLEAITNNVPGEALSEEFVQRRRLPDGANWIPRKGYKVLDKTYERVLYPRLAARIRTFRGVPLSDVLMRYQKWDGRTPIRVRMRIFEALPLGTRLVKIARDYLGGTSMSHIRQIYPLTRRAAHRLILEPMLASSRRRRTAYPVRFRRFYIVQVLGPVGTPVTTTAAPATLPPLTAPRGTVPVPLVRSNSIVIKLGQLDQFRVRVYFNAPTVKGILGPVATSGPVELERRIRELVVSYGARSVRRLLERLKIPSPIARGISASLVRFVMRYIRRNLSSLLQRLGQLGSSADGITITFTAQLPANFLRNLLRSPASFMALRRQLKSIAPTLDILPGYYL